MTASHYAPRLTPIVAAPATAPAAAPAAVPAAALAIPLEMQEALSFIHRIGGASLLDKIVTLFRSSSEERLVLLRSAAAHEDRSALARLAHALKESAAQVGAESLCGAAATLERRAESLPIDTITVEVEALAALTALAREQLETQRQELVLQAATW